MTLRDHPTRPLRSRQCSTLIGRGPGQRRLLPGVAQEGAQLDWMWIGLAALCLLLSLTAIPSPRRAWGASRSGRRGGLVVLGLLLVTARPCTGQPWPEGSCPWLDGSGNQVNSGSTVGLGVCHDGSDCYGSCSDGLGLARCPTDAGGAPMVMCENANCYAPGMGWPPTGTQDFNCCHSIAGGECQFAGGPRTCNRPPPSPPSTPPPPPSPLAPLGSLSGWYREGDWTLPTRRRLDDGDPARRSLSQTSGSWTDSSGQGNHATLSGAGFSSPTAVPGNGAVRAVGALRGVSASPRNSPGGFIWTLLRRA